MGTQILGRGGNFRARGISRVDVAVVIACLSLVAGFAIPRQDGMSRDERRAAVRSLAQNTASALALAHTRWENAGRPGAVESPRGAIAMVNGYPSVATLPLMLAEGEASAFNYSQGSWQHRDSTSSNCGIAYSPPPAADAPPRLRIATDGC